ncbi:MAG: FeoB small GTPase domain-containing protein [Candidatus Omnitrophota bacterium]
MKKLKILILGSPNVGKSLVFGNLTNEYVIVSNYPGTTVEVTRGKAMIGQAEYEVIDSPGLYSLLTVSEDEKVTKRILFNEKPDILIHVVDAKNIERMLSLSLQLIETEIPVILVLNIMDEARKEGVSINSRKLEKILKIPVVEAVSTRGAGTEELKKRIAEYGQKL